MKWTAATPFNEQVGELTRVFSQWNECEQTVVLYALLRRIPAVQARFLAQAVQHALHSVTELDTKEINANNTGNSILMIKCIFYVYFKSYSMHQYINCKMSQIFQLTLIHYCRNRRKSRFINS